jgi:flagellar assembly protein FliH
MIKAEKTRSKVLANPAEDELAVWPLPNVAKQLTEREAQQTNALGLTNNWRFEPPEEQEIAEPVPLTAEQIEQIRQAAFDEGFNQGKEQGFATGYDEGKAKGVADGEQQGHEQGLATGLTEAQQKIDELTQQWQSLIEQLHKPLAVVEKNIEQQLLQLVVQLTETVVQQEAKTNPDILMAAISAGIKALPSQAAQTQVYLHPEDIKLVEQGFGAEHIQESGWRLLPAPQFARGSCQIENATSSIDLQVKTRLKEVLEPFLQHSIHQ